MFSGDLGYGGDEAPVHITAEVWVLAGLRGPCSGRPKSRNLASNQGEVFRQARAKQVHGNPTKFDKSLRVLLYTSHEGM